jgi:hypothetical protein
VGEGGGSNFAPYSMEIIQKMMRVKEWFLKERRIPTT